MDNYMVNMISHWNSLKNLEDYYNEERIKTEEAIQNYLKKLFASCPQSTQRRVLAARRFLLPFPKQAHPSPDWRDFSSVSPRTMPRTAS